MTTDQCNARGSFLQPKTFDWGDRDQVWGHLRTRGTQSVSKTEVQAVHPQTDLLEFGGGFFFHVFFSLFFIFLFLLISLLFFYSYKEIWITKVLKEYKKSRRHRRSKNNDTEGCCEQAEKSRGPTQTPCSFSQTGINSVSMGQFCTNLKMRHPYHMMS